jgi:hypothetical protein
MLPLWVNVIGPERVLRFNQPVGLAIRRRIYAPLYSGAELYQVFESVTLFEPEQSANLWFDGVLNQTFE